MNEEQYKILAARKIAHDTMVWQTPTLAIAAQAFLLSAAYNQQVDRPLSLLLLGFSTAVGICSIQLMSKHRLFELSEAKLLREFEEDHEREGYSVITRERTADEKAGDGILVRFSAFQVWRIVLMGLCLIACFAFYEKFMGP
jgi:hypothetical protein